MRPVLSSLVFLFLATNFGCRPAGSLATRNFAPQYAEIPKAPLLQVVPFSQNEKTTLIYVRWVDNGPVLRNGENGKEKSQAAFSLHFDVYPNYQSPILLDSGTFLIADSLHAASSHDFEFEVKAPQGINTLLNLELTDRRSKASCTAAFNILKNGQGSSSFFKARQGPEMLYSPVLKTTEPVVISYANTGIKRIYGSLFRYNFVLPAPPFVIEDRKAFDKEADSNFMVFLKNGNSAPLELNQRGFYFFSADSTFHEGFTLFRYSPGFPELISPRQMLLTLRYITSAKEYTKLNSSPDIRHAVDSFWIASAGNSGRALRLIHDYYSRVERANELFSSHTEGWQTDRGMIYIIFGMPKIVYRHNYQEEWVYGEVRNLRSLHFYFLKAENPFTTSDFVLSRDPTLKQAWYMAVEKCRK